MALYILQLLFVPLPLLLSGLIMCFQGWRLDPSLQFGYFLLQAPLVYLGIKDFLLYRNQ
ncbi:MAG: hypothetical protein HC866_13620 [Leptolyngbyaceae cyanobacterium RU_5_1]|nr:hypothetical protein [Leptolyngbyaceae cyanobacterium RU_5_1]